MLLGFLWVIVRDGWPKDVPFWVQWPIVAMFVISVIVLSVWLFGIPMTEARIGRDRVLRLKRRWLLRSSEARIRPEHVTSAQVFEDTDAEGDPYFRCRLWLKDGGHADLSEGADRERIATDAAAVRAALGIG